MRRMIRTTGIAAAGFVLAVGVAGASALDEQNPESRAYFSLSFGGAKIAPRDLHYGLRIDHDSRFLEGEAVPLMQFDFTRSGLSDARLNGLSVLKQRYRLHQSEEQAAEEAGAEAPAEEFPAEEAPAEEATMEEATAEEDTWEAPAEEGFFSGMWSGVTGFFGGLFGDDEEGVEEVTETAEAGTEAPPEDLAEGVFMSYNMVDWGLLALGVAGVGLAASEVAGGDETADPPGGVGGPNGGGGDGTPGEPCIVTVPVPLPEGCDPNALMGRRSGGAAGTATLDPEYQKWLDSGTGHMGDLGD